jgi:hypothetical protein
MIGCKKNASPGRICFCSSLFVLLTLHSFAFTQELQRPPQQAINLTNLRLDFIHVSARPAAMGGAFIGAAQDESAAAINPAGLTYEKRIGVSLNQRSSKVNYREPQGIPGNPDATKPSESTNFAQSMVGFYIPFKKFTIAAFREVMFDALYEFETQQFLTIPAPLNPRQVLGGLGNYAGRSLYLQMEVVSDAVALAFEVHNRLSLGITVKNSTLKINMTEYNYLDPALLTASMPAANSAQTLYSFTRINNRLQEYHFSAGLMAKLVLDKLFFGAVYNYNPAYTLTSNTYLPLYRLDTLSFSPVETENSFQLAIPHTYGFGFYYNINRFRLTFDVLRIGYSRLLSKNNRNVPYDDIWNPDKGSYEDSDPIDLRLKDATQFHFGFEYIWKLSDKLSMLRTVPVRFGLYTDPGHRIHAAGSDPDTGTLQDMQRLFPEAKTRVHYSLGLGVILTKNIKLDVAMIESSDRFELFGSALLSIPL